MARALAVDHGGGAQALLEPPQFPGRGRALGEIDEVDGDAALREEALGLARVRIVPEAEDLHVHVARAWAMRASRASQAAMGTSGIPGGLSRPVCAPWK